MDIGTASALTLSSYQAAVTSYGQGSNSASPALGSAASSAGSSQDTAALQALAGAYTNLASHSNSLLPAPDTLSQLAGSGGALGSLANGIYKLSAAGGNATPNLSALSATAASVGGLNATTASLLFAGTGSQGSDNLTSSAINMNTALALASYSGHLSGVPGGTLGTAATAAAADINPARASDVQKAIQSAQASLSQSMLNLFG